MTRRPLAAVVPVLDDLLRVVPRATGVGQEDGHEGTAGDRPGEEARERPDAQTESDDDRGQGGEQARGGELGERVARADVDDPRVLGLFGALHDPGVLTELTAHLVDDRARGHGDRVDRQARKQEDDRGAEEQADEHARRDDLGVDHELEVGDLLGRDAPFVDGRQGTSPGIGVAAEEGGRGEHGGRDGDALGDRLGRVADRVELGEHLSRLTIDVTGHLGDALRVVRDRAKGVHGDDDPDGRQQSAAGERDEEEAEDDGGAAEQEGEVDAHGDGHDLVDRRLEAQADPRQDHGGGAGLGRAGDVHRRALVGAGVVAGHPQDHRGEDDAEDDREQGGAPRVADQLGDRLVGGAELGVGAGQVEVGRGGAQHGRDRRGDEEAPVDGIERRLARARPGDEDADHRRDRTDGRDEQGEDEPVGAEGRRAEDERGDEHHGVGLEEVGGHARAVADVVAHVVRDRRRIAGVVLGDARLDLADEVGADVSGLGEDAAADPHEHREERGAEAEALEHLGRITPVDEDDDGRAEQTEAHGEHADGAAGAEGDAHAVVAAGGAGRLGDADVGLDRERHPEIPDGGGEAGAEDEEPRATPPHARGVRGQEEQEDEDERDEDEQGPELAAQVGVRALLDRPGDLLHAGRARAGGEHLASEDDAEHEGQQADDGDTPDQTQIGAVEVDRRCGGQGRERDSHAILLDGRGSRPVRHQAGQPRCHPTAGAPPLPGPRPRDRGGCRGAGRGR